tara:strand:+ start:88 stop:297 length:210 start_codon:yes stop_codon:yes gene_type:complete
MENTKIIFASSEHLNTGKEMQIHCNLNNEIFIKIYDWEVPELYEWITLNKATAAKFSKVLKHEIFKIES